jgi:hypothetical protein
MDKSRQVSRMSTGDQIPIHHDLLVQVFSTGILDILADGFPPGDLPALENLSRD